MTDISIPDMIGRRWMVTRFVGSNDSALTLEVKDIADPDETMGDAKYYPASSFSYNYVLNYSSACALLQGFRKIYESGTNYIVFEQLKGYESLEEYIKRTGTCKPKRAREICGKVIEVLREADEHEFRTNHYQINPCTVYIGKGGEVVLDEWATEAAYLRFVLTNRVEFSGFQPTEVKDLRGAGRQTDFYSLGALYLYLQKGESDIARVLRGENGDLPRRIAKNYSGLFSDNPGERARDWDELTRILNGKRTHYKYSPMTRKDEEDEKKVVATAAAVAAAAAPAAVPAKKEKEKKQPKQKRVKPERKPLMASIREGYEQKLVPWIQRTSDKVNWKKLTVLIATTVILTGLIISAIVLPGALSTTKIEDPETESAAITKLPDLTGKSYEEAEAEATSLGCSVEKADSYSEEAAGIVIAQDPGGGHDVSEGLAVILTVSIGPDSQADATTETGSQPTTTTKPDDSGEPAPAPEPEPAPAPGGQSPVAAFTMSPSSGPSSGVFVSFNASGSNDPDGGPLTYSWSFGSFGTASGESVSMEFHSATGPASIPCTLRVTDDEGQTSTVQKTFYLNEG